MATRALAAAGRRAAGHGHGGLAALSSSGSCCRRGGAAAAQRQFSHSSTAERERDAHADATPPTAAQVEAALNRKNVDVMQGEGRSETLLAADAAAALRGVAADDGDGGAAAAGAEDAWVPDQETGVFVPADEASGVTGDGTGNGNGHTAGTPSVLDQAVFVREEDMEDVERPAVGGAVDVTDADAGAK